MCSDHLEPWSVRQGHSGFAWAWLGAAMQTTRVPFGTVNAPGQRYHPAVIAQAAGTLAEMFPERFWFALGSGEALNEHVTGEAWPSKHTRNSRLRECAAIMRALWAGETVTHHGHVRIDRARVYSRPSSPPLLFAAALSPETAREHAHWADGLVTVAGARDQMTRIIDAFRSDGGDAKPIFLQTVVSYARSDEEAADAAFDQWRHCGLTRAQLADVSSPEAFDEACGKVSRADVLERVRTSSDIARHLAWVREAFDLGFDAVFLHNVARDHQERFIEAASPHLATTL